MARPFLPAAPGRGAMQAVWELAFRAETAKAQGESSATTTFDMKQYYEWITPTELGIGAKRHGLPRTITTMLIHFYTGPRRIRVGNAVSKAIYPRRSILAGCPWALLAIRLITAEPVEKFLKLTEKRMYGWGATSNFSFYVDDATVTTAGSVSAIVYLHEWICKLVIQWIEKGTEEENSGG